LKKIIVLFTLAILALACDRTAFNGSDRIIARVYDKYLYFSDIKNLVPNKISAADSLNITLNYVNNWVRNQLLLHQAEKNLTSYQKDFSQQLEDYRNSLIVYKYETELIKQNLDTIISRGEIEDYYYKHASNFKLNENIVQLVYAKVNEESPYLVKIKKLVKSQNESDRDSLEFYCIRYAENYGVIDREWITFDEMMQRVPVHVSNPEIFLAQNKTIDYFENPDWYFLQILNYGLIDSISPLSLEQENIRSVILNKRKKLLIKKMQDEVYEQAQKENNFEYF